MQKTKTRDCQKRAAMKWQKENYSRVAFDLPKAEHEELKAYVAERGLTVGAFLKNAIVEKQARDSIQPEAQPEADYLPESLKTKAEIGAKLAGQDLAEFISGAIADKVKAVEAAQPVAEPMGPLTGLITWMTSRGFSSDEISDCFLHLGAYRRG